MRDQQFERQKVRRYISGLDEVWLRIIIEQILCQPTSKIFLYNCIEEFDKFYSLEKEGLNSSDTMEEDQ